jgi:hypothetical protein
MTRLDDLKSCVVLLLCVATAIASAAETTFTTLVNFDGTNGAGPGYESLVQGTTETSTGQPQWAGPTTPARFSKSPPWAS